MEPIEIGGQKGTVAYLDSEFRLTTPEHATLAKVLFENGESAFFAVAADTPDDRNLYRDRLAEFLVVRADRGRLDLHVVKRGAKWCVVTKDYSRAFGCHQTDPRDHPRYRRGIQGSTKTAREVSP